MRTDEKQEMIRRYAKSLLMEDIDNGHDVGVNKFRILGDKIIK